MVALIWQFSWPQWAMTHTDLRGAGDQDAPTLAQWACTTGDLGHAVRAWPIQPGSTHETVGLSCTLVSTDTR